MSPIYPQTRARRSHRLLRCYPIMPCKYTRPYSPHVSQYIACLSTPRCISGKKLKTRFQKEAKLKATRKMAYLVPLHLNILKHPIKDVLILMCPFKREVTDMF